MVVSGSSMRSIVLPFVSRFSLIIPMIFSFVFGGVLYAALMVMASRVSILCFRSFWSFSKRLRKYWVYSSMVPVVQIFVVGSSMISSSGSMSLAYGWKVFLDS